MRSSFPPLSGNARPGHTGRIAMRLALVLFLMLPALGVPRCWAGEAPDLAEFPTCRYCGMDRRCYPFSRMIVHYADGTRFASCSLHCLALDLAVQIDKTPETILVGDFGSGKLIDAETAQWVIGGSKPGVMTRRAKWAFERKRDAMTFISENGGDLTTFEDAMKAAYDDMFTDTRMIRGKRKIRKMTP